MTGGEQPRSLHVLIGRKASEATREVGGRPESALLLETGTLSKLFIYSKASFTSSPKLSYRGRSPSLINITAKDTVPPPESLKPTVTVFDDSTTGEVISNQDICEYEELFRFLHSLHDQHKGNLEYKAPSTEANSAHCDAMAVFSQTTKFTANDDMYLANTLPTSPTAPRPVKTNTVNPT